MRRLFDIKIEGKQPFALSRSCPWTFVAVVVVELRRDSSLGVQHKGERLEQWPYGCKEAYMSVPLLSVISICVFTDSELERKGTS